MLATTFTECGTWVVARKTLSSQTVQYHVEIQLRYVIDLYATLVSTGFQLTATSHLTFTHLCTCFNNAQHMNLGEIIDLRVEITFLDNGMDAADACTVNLVS